MKKQTLAQAIKAVRAYAISKGESYFSVQQKWQSKYGDANEGDLTFTAYIHGFSHIDSTTIEGLIDQFNGLTQAPPALSDEDLNLPF